MPIYRVTYGFAGNGVGSSETHMLNSQLTNARAVIATLGPVRDARADMLAYPFQVVGIRVSRYSDGAVPAVRLDRSVWLDKTKSTRKANVKKWAAEPNSVQYQALGTAPANFTPSKYAGNKNYTYLGYPTDDSVNDNGVVDPAVNNLGGLFAVWKQLMIATGHGWGASVKGDPLDISAFVQNPDATVSFTTAAVDTALFPTGRIYPIRVRRVNNGRSPLNGAFSARLVDATTWKTEEQVAFKLAQTNGKLTPYWPVLQFVPYADITLEATVVKHKRGRPFLSEPGRAKARIRA